MPRDYLRLTCLPAVINIDSRVLVLGTMPGAQSLQKRQYYGNPGNRFWRVLYGLWDLPPEADYTARIEFVKSKGIALWDVVKQCTRAGSSDSNIKDITVNDFGALLEKYPGVRCLAFSSQKASQLFQKYALPRLGGEEASALDFIVLPSPSGHNARVSFPQLLAAWQKIRDYLQNKRAAA